MMISCNISKGIFMKKILLVFILLQLCCQTQAFAKKFKPTQELKTTIEEIEGLNTTGKYKQALNLCDKMISIYPKSGDLYYLRAFTKLSMDEKADVLEDYNKAIELSPKNSDMYLMRGIFELNNGDKELALDDFNKSIKFNSKNEAAYSMRASIKFKQGKYKAANKDLKKAVELCNKKYPENL